MKPWYVSVLLQRSGLVEVIPEEGLGLHQLPGPALLRQDRGEAERGVVDILRLFLRVENLLEGLVRLLLPLALLHQERAKRVQEHWVVRFMSQHLPQLGSGLVELLLPHEQHHSIQRIVAFLLHSIFLLGRLGVGVLRLRRLPARLLCRHLFVNAVRFIFWHR